MAGTTSTPSGNQSIGSVTQEVFVPAKKCNWFVPSIKGRDWSGEAIDRFVVGRIHGHFDLKDSCLHLHAGSPDFDTEAELQHFENHILTKTNIVQRWSSEPFENAEVQKVLADIAIKALDRVANELEKLIG